MGKFKRLEPLWWTVMEASHQAVLSTEINAEIKQAINNLFSHCILRVSFKMVEEMPVDIAATIHSILIQS